MSQLRPMLAAPAPDNLDELKYPLFASSKLDGVRAIIVDGKVLSRTLKPIPNYYIQDMFGRPELNGLDGELLDGDPAAKNCYSRTVSTVMSEGKDITDVRYWVFDHVGHGWYYDRLSYLKSKVWHPRVNLLIQDSMFGPRDIEVKLSEELAKGFEGLILRYPASPYKYGRSTQKQQWMLKLKPFEDAEAEVIGFEELMHNANPAQKDERGYTKHSTHQANLVPQGTLGSLTVKFNGDLFSIGTGFTQEQRQEIWANRSMYLGALAKFKYQRYGMKDAPRQPVFLGWRDRMDREEL